MLNQVIFYFLSIKLSRSDNSGHEFGGLTRVVFYILFLIDFFLISSFKIELIGDWNLLFIFICFPWGYLGFMNWVESLTC
jgi:hypothetical protein